MARRWIPRACGVVFAAGIAGLVVSSVAGNNNGWVLTVGLVICFAAAVLLTYSAVANGDRIDAFTDADAEAFESRIQQLVAAGADEHEVRALVRDALAQRRR
jgi:cell division protein FtsW (lipid II flippase)